MVIRQDYIKAISPYIDQPLVKILPGVRRCGKSTIFEMLAQELLSRGVPEECIIQKRYTEMDIPADVSAKDMYQELLPVSRERAGAIFCWMRFRKSPDGSGV